MASFARTGNGVELPLLLASRGVVCGKEAANAIIAASYPDDDRMVHDKRRSSKRKSIGWFRHLSLPIYFPGVRINGNQISVQTAKKERIIQDSKSPVHLTASNGKSIGIGRSYFQITSPVFASRATTVAGGSVTKIVSLTTSGVDSNLGSLVLD